MRSKLKRIDWESIVRSRVASGLSMFRAHSRAARPSASRLNNNAWTTVHAFVFSLLALLLVAIVGCDRGQCTRQSDCPATESCTIESVCAPAADDAGGDAAIDAPTDAAVDAPTDAAIDAP